jgi:hypothetical protein
LGTTLDPFGSVNARKVLAQDLLLSGSNSQPITVQDSSGEVNFSVSPQGAIFTRSLVNADSITARTANITTLTLSGPMQLGHTKMYSVIRNPPTSTSDFVNIGSINDFWNKGQHHVEIAMSQYSPGGGSMRKYTFIKNYDISSGGNWEELMPDTWTADRGGEGLRLDVRYGNSGALEMRIRQAGTQYANTGDYPVLISLVNYNNGSLTESFSTGTGATVSGYYTNSPMTQYQDKFGFGTSTPIAKVAITGLTTSSNPGFVFADASNTPQFMILDNGNVGLGTTTPSYKLAVLGTLYVSGTSTLSSTTISGLATAQNGIVLSSTTPATTTFALYNQGGLLYWNGFSIPTSSTSFTAGNGVSASGTQFILGGTLTQNTTVTLSTFGFSIGSTTFSSSGLITVGGSILPASNLTYDLGSATNQFRSLYVGSSTIYIAGLPLSLTNQSALYWGGSGIAATTGTSSFGAFTAGQATLSTTTISGELSGGSSTLTTLRAGTTSISGQLSLSGVGTTTGITLLAGGASGSTSLVVLDNGNVGVGTSSPSAQFSVQGSGYYGNDLSANSATGYQLGQMNSGGGMNDPKLSPYFHDYTFRRNIFANVSNNWNLGMPGFFFENNTFYRAAYTQGGLVSGGSLTRGDSSRLTYLSNAFIGGGAGSDTNGFYSNSGAGLGQEVLRFYVTMEPATEANPLTPIAAGIMNDLIANGYVNGNGVPSAKARALASVSDFVIAPAYASYKDGVYTYLKMTADLDNNIKNTFTANYNFVSGPASAGYPAKRADGCTSGVNTNFRFCEPNGVNGGDPKLKDVNDPDGPDNIPFTPDDGLKPLPGSPLCAKGANGVDIGVYSCDPSKVFATGNSGTAGITGGSYTPTTPGTPSTPTNPPVTPPTSHPHSTNHPTQPKPCA